jgi:hypothetical protein
LFAPTCDYTNYTFAGPANLVAAAFGRNSLAAGMAAQCLSEVKLACAELAWSQEIDLLLESAVRLFRANEGCRSNAKET